MAEIEIKLIIQLLCIPEQVFYSFSAKAAEITQFQKNQSQKEMHNHNP